MPANPDYRALLVALALAAVYIGLEVALYLKEKRRGRE